MIKKILRFLPAIVLIGVVAYFIVTTSPSVRMWVDEFCSATQLRNYGFFGSQAVWWRSWTGRYSFIALLDLFEKIGPWTTRITPLLVFPLLIITIIPALSFSIILSALFAVISLINAPNVIQSFYWQMGSINYIAPFIFLNIFISILVRGRRKINLLIPFMLLFVAGGFSEAFAVSGLVLLFFILATVILIKPKDKKDLVKVIIVGIVGAALSLVVMLLAPGNAAREMTVTHPESIAFVIKSTILGTKWYLLRLMGIRSFVYSLVILFSGVFLFGKKYILKPKTALLIMFISIFSAILSTAAVIGSGFYSMSILPPDRTLFTAVYIDLLCFLVLSFAASSLLRNILSEGNQKLLYWAVIILNILASVVLIKSIIQDWGRMRTKIQTYGREFDQMEPKLVGSVGQREITIKNIRPVGELDSFTDNNGWVAACLAGYYRVGSIKIEK